VEVRDNPALAGLPVVVGGSKEQRGVVSAASYEARRYGVRSAMPMSEALRRCPELVRLPVRMDRYVEVSRTVMDILSRFTPTLEPLSLDEAFLDLGGTERSLGSSLDIAARIKGEILGATGLSASIGIAAVKFVAKIASDLRKPNGLVIVEAGETESFLAPLPIARLWGVGPRSQEALAQLGIRTIGDLARAEPQLLEKHFGKSGVTLHRLAIGQDEREVVAEREAKSYGHEVTFAVDESDREALLATLLDHVSRVARRLRRDGVAGRTFVLKLRDASFHTITRRVTHERPSADVDEIYRGVVALFDAAWDGRPVRLIGAGVSGIRADADEPTLLGPDPRRERSRRLADALDRLEGRFGHRIIRAGTMRSRELEDTGSSLSIEHRERTHPSKREDRGHRKGPS
jgi:DNA polymerase-4